MEVGEVRVADDRDFQRFLNLADSSEEGWLLKYNKNGTKVWVQNPKTTVGNEKARMLKTYKYMEDVSAATCYDVIHDPYFRQEWDSTMLEGREVYMLNPNNDISYFAVKCPSPLKNRDFIMQRTWLQTPTEYVIFNHSIYHKEFPPRKGLIRGESILTGYLVRPKTKTSCELTYVTQTDPKGAVPMWAVNKVAEYLAPSLLKNLHKACQRYPAWKTVNNPHFKPWLYPEQMNLPRLSVTDVLAKNTFSSEESLEDGDLKEEDFKGGNTPSSSTSKISSDNNHQHPHSNINSRQPQRLPTPRTSSPLRQAQSEMSLIPTHSSSNQPSSSSSHPSYSQSNHRPGTRDGKLHDKPHHASTPAIYNVESSRHSQTLPPSQSTTVNNGAPVHPEQTTGHTAPAPHGSPLRYVRKKFAKWAGYARQSSEDLRSMEYEQLQKEIMIREHEARIHAHQEDLEMKRREHQARMEILESISHGTVKIPPSEVQRVLLHRTSSIVTNEMVLGNANEMVLGNADVKSDMNGYRIQSNNRTTRAIQHL